MELSFKSYCNEYADNNDLALKSVLFNVFKQIVARNAYNHGLHLSDDEINQEAKEKLIAQDRKSVV
jgi:hypothetical protein